MIRTIVFVGGIAAAKIAAGEFAAALDSEVGGMHKANQGVIAILAHDDGAGAENQSPDKRIRAVTTVEYLLVC